MIFKKKGLKTEATKKAEGTRQSTSEQDFMTQDTRDADFSEDENHDENREGSAESEGTVSNSEVDTSIEKLRKELVEQRESYLRALADFDNYKKRTMKERSDLIKYQGERIFQDLLEVIDNFERAVTSNADPVQFRAGVDLIYKMFTDLLVKYEVRADSAVGKSFDPSRQEAISQVELDDTKPGTVISELRKAYMYKDKLLRFGAVVVAAPRNGGERKGKDEGSTDKEGCEV